jgi:TolB-like protein/AraC-like DNA-binding protein
MIRATKKRVLNPEEIDFLKKALEVVELKLNEEKFGVEELANSLNLSRPYLHRKLKKLTGLSPSSFIRQIRLNHAKKKLEEGDKTSSEIAYLVGFGSPAYFTKCFHDHFGYPPGVAKNKNKEIKKSKHYNVESFIEKLIYTPKENRWSEDLEEIHIPFWKRPTFVYSMVIIIIGLGIISILTIRNLKEQRQFQQLGKSIAVLPFRNDSEEEGTGYFANGVTEEILNNLAKISELRVPGRTSVEQFRETTKSTTEIAEILNVSFILEGSIQKFGDDIKINIQLLNALEDKHVWSKAYEYKYESQFDIINEIAQRVTKEIKVNINPQELQFISKIPTYNLTAYDIFLQAQNLHNRSGLDNAVILYRAALVIDSTFAKAYSGLGMAYIDKHYYDTFLETDFLDSAFYLANIALSYDKQLEEAYYVRGLYFALSQGDFRKAINEYDKALKLNPNYYKAYHNKGNIYMTHMDDIVKALENYHKGLDLNYDPQVLRDLATTYWIAGFFETANYYSLKALKLDKDSLSYCIYMTRIKNTLGNFSEELFWAKKASQIDSFNFAWVWVLSGAYLENKNWNLALKYDSLLINIGYDNPVGLHRRGYALYQLGQKKEAEYCFKKQIENIEKILKLNRPIHGSYYEFYDIAGAYAFMGNKEETYRYLNEFEKKKFYPIWMVNLIKRDPLFDNLREEEEFKMILSNIEEKYLAEHERVKVWLEENDML